MHCSYVLRSLFTYFWVHEVIKETKMTTSWVCTSSHQSTWHNNRNPTLLKIMYGCCCKKLQILKRFTHICTISIVRKTPGWGQFDIRPNNQICPCVWGDGQGHSEAGLLVYVLCEMMSCGVSWIKTGVFSLCPWGHFAKCWRNWLEVFLR